MNEPSRVSSIRENAALFQQMRDWVEMESRLKDMQAQVTEATTKEAMATAKCAELEKKLEEMDAEEDALEERLQRTLEELAAVRASAGAAQDALQAERQARQAADARASAMIAKLKDQPVVNVQPAAAAAAAKTAGWTVKIHRDGADNMLGFDLTPKKG